MGIGVSSYSFSSSLRAGRLDLPGVVDWIADNGADHLELALDSEAADNTGLLDAIGSRAGERGVTLANYVIGADFLAEDLRAQVAHVTKHLQAAKTLGITRFRHDVAAWAWRPANQRQVEDAYERIVPIVAEVADVAAELGITTTVENHGMFMNDPERVARLVEAVDRPNFAVTLDVGNFVCVAADPLLAVRRLLPYAAVVHLKDFRIRPVAPSARWLRTLNDDAILGTIVGWGDLPLPAIAAAMTESGFDGPVSIEFEGVEDDVTAVTEGLVQARALLGRTSNQEVVR